MEKLAIHRQTSDIINLTIRAFFATLPVETFNTGECAMLSIDGEHKTLCGPKGTLEIPEDDEVIFKFAMLFEG